MNKSSNPIFSVGKDTLLYTPGKLLPSLFAFVGISVYTRILSPAEYGEYSLIMTMISVMGLFTYSWIGQSNLRFYSSYKFNNLDVFISTSFLILMGSLVSSIVMLLFIAKYAIILRDTSSIFYLPLSIGVLISTAFFEYFSNILRADRNSKYVSSSLILSSGLSLIVSLFLLYLNMGISSIFIGIIIANIVLTLFLAYKLKIQKYIRIKSFSKNTMKEFSDYGVPLITTLVFSWILELSDRYLIAYFNGSEAVGIYSATCQLASYPMSLISSILIFAAFPIIIDTWNLNGKEATKDLITKITRYYLLIAIPALTMVIVMAKEMMWILGNAYSGGSHVLPWICFGSVISGLCVYVNKGMELTKNTKILSLLVGIAGSCNILMNLFFIPKYSFYGAGIATALAYVIYFIVSVIISKKYLTWSVNTNSLLNSIIASSVMGIILLITKGIIKGQLLNITFSLFFGICIYIIILLISKEITYEISFIKKIFSLQ
ncbi:lipopolysaccharide biosynthesis protein [Methanosarcina mazei]|uniref:Uncharacterized protein n=1 Tax=Methanosarcina mazei TaxID=2209 RepID=A0A0F8S4J5_METMZ|nr:oligosaccharide flippase family protein [Methanosarcina mazei]KKH68194.1 hypothetical protein DU87_06090 [Methanosarcina mazei]